MSDYYVEENRMANEGIVRADRSAAGLPIIVPPVRGDLGIVVQLRLEVATLTAEVERLRLTEEELQAINAMVLFAEDHLGSDDPCVVSLAGLRDRHGGGE